MVYDFIVFGAFGLQGRIVTRDLVERGYNVVLSDRIKPTQKYLQKLNNPKFIYADLRNLAGAVDVLKSANTSVVVNCAEGDFNLALQNLCLKYNSHYVDLGSDHEMTVDQFKLHDVFKKKKLWLTKTL